MIPKIIHYCWFGRNPKPKIAERCIKSWEKKCKGYKIIEWNEDNFDINSCPLYVRQAYEAKKWAFVTDYVRLKIVYEYGGVYFDTDVELVKKPDFLMTHRAWFGFEDEQYTNTGLGFGAEAGHPILAEMMAQYENILFVLADGTFDQTPCPQRNTEVFLKRGLVQNNSMQILEDDILILPKIYLCPIDSSTGHLTRSKETVSIHHFAGTWYTAEERMRYLSWQQNQNLLFRIKHFPCRVAEKLLGKTKYENLKTSLKKKK